MTTKPERKTPRTFTGHLLGIGHSSHEVETRNGTAILPALMLKVLDPRDHVEKVLRVLFNHDDTARVAELLQEQAEQAAERARAHFEGAVELAHLIAVHETGDDIQIVTDDPEKEY